jgi:hypothetical protein
MTLFHKIQIPVLCMAALFISACSGNHAKNGSDTATNAPADVKTVAPVTVQPTGQSSKPATPATVYRAPTPTENKYNDLRISALTTTPNDLKIAVPADKNIVYGVVTDQEADGAVTTLAAYKTGAVSLYTSAGNVIGDSKHPVTSNIARVIVAQAQNFVDKATKARDTSIPDKGMVKFYLLTNKGIFVVNEPVKGLTGHTSPFADLFDKVNKVLAQLKQANGK